jgi:hypothetical protein
LLKVNLRLSLKQERGVTNFTKALMASQSDLVYLVRAPSKPGMKMAWYYVQVASKAKLPIFLKEVKKGTNLEALGTILYSGWGDEPPDDIKQKIKDQFG